MEWLLYSIGVSLLLGGGESCGVLVGVCGIGDPRVLVFPIDWFAGSSRPPRAEPCRGVAWLVLFPYPIESFLVG